MRRRKTRMQSNDSTLINDTYAYGEPVFTDDTGLLLLMDQETFEGPGRPTVITVEITAP